MVLAVLTAKAGLYAEPDVLDGPQGLWKMMGSKAYKEEKILEEIGTRWDIHEMQIKPYASCRWSHAAVDGLYALKSEFDYSEVDKIEVYTFQAATSAVSGRNPTSMLGMQFSVPHVFGMIMHDESLIYMKESSITNQDVIKFSEKVEVKLDEKYEDLFAQGMLPAKVVVQLKNGKLLEKEVLRMKGEMQNPITKKEHDSKINELIASSPYEHVRDYAWSIINIRSETH
jgi:2-methylcitrate dehydratase PrpD